ncbi:transposase [Streptomyces sp. AHU1]|uniref:transposase n=1 Tax=Streptomyces sp. AHU1 TaxID=3377215 RepID=UPI003877D183
MAAGKSCAAACNGWIFFKDEAGQSMTPPRSRTWGRIGRTPVVRVRGRGSGRVSMAGMTCYKPGERSRRNLRDFLVRARIRLGRPIVVVWDNVRLHLTAGMREFITADAAWPTVFQLPAHTPDPNPQEGSWSLVKCDLGNLAAADLGQITRAVKRRLKQIRYRPDFVDSCLAGTSLITDD